MRFRSAVWAMTRTSTPTNSLSALSNNRMPSLVGVNYLVPADHHAFQGSEDSRVLVAGLGQHPGQARHGAVRSSKAEMAQHGDILAQPPKDGVAIFLQRLR